MQTIEPLIDILHLEDLRNRLHPSIFDDNGTYNIFILCLSIIAENMSYLYNIKKQEFEELNDLLIGKFGVKKYLAYLLIAFHI